MSDLDAEVVEEKSTKSKKKLNRFFCVYFVSKSENEINRINKRTRVVEASTASKVEDILIKKHKCTYVKSIRDLEELKNKYYIYNELVNKIDIWNNFNLKEDNKDEKKDII